MSIKQWPDNLFDLLINKDGQAIYSHVQYSAQDCLSGLKEAIQNKEVDREHQICVESAVQEELSEAGELRFSLNTIDNRIRREKNNSVPLRNHIRDAVKNGQVDNHELLIGLLGQKDQDGIDQEVLQAVHCLRVDINQSLRYRIQMTWCWDEVINQHRQILIQQAVVLGHGLTEIAILLQSSEAIEKVREILCSLDLNVPRENPDPTLPSGTKDLHKFLTDGIARLDRIHDHVVRIDQQKGTLQRAQCELNARFESTASEPKPYSGTLQKDHSAADPARVKQSDGMSSRMFSRRD
ncbi:MAG: hypothetical protein ACOX5R_17840 [bacterium]